MKFARLYAFLFLSGCATMTNGAREGLEIASDPPGATAMTDIPSNGNRSLRGYLGCEPTPCSISIPRKLSPVVTISHNGYDPIRFKVVSSVATSATSVQEGTIVAGLPPGSHVIAGQPDVLKRIPSGGRVVTGGILTLGVGSAIDGGVGANKNLSPNPVIAILAPTEEMIENEADNL